MSKSSFIIFWDFHGDNTLFSFRKKYFFSIFYLLFFKSSINCKEKEDLYSLLYSIQKYIVRQIVLVTLTNKHLNRKSIFYLNFIDYTYSITDNNMIKSYYSCCFVSKMIVKNLQFFAVGYFFIYFCAKICT